MFNLDPVPQYRLARPPLVQALAQVRFPLIAKILTYSGISPLQDALSSEFPYMKRVDQTSINVELAGMEARPEQETSWKFSDDDGRLIIVAANSATLSLGSQYVGVDDFVDRFANVLRAMQGALSLRRCEQLGIRFLDLVPDMGEEEGSWKRWFHNTIVGWAASEIVRGDTRLTASISQIQMVSPAVDDLSIMPAEVQAIVRHGIAPQGSIVPGHPPTRFEENSFFLDIDLFVNGHQEFDLEKIIEQTRALHSHIDRFFRWSLTEEGESHFGLKEVV